MAGQRETALLPVASETSALLQPLGSADLVQNFRRTKEGTLAPVTGPAPLIPDYGQGYLTWGNPHGVCHARLGPKGTRDVLLVHTGTSIYVQDGPTRSRVLLVGAAGSGAQFETTLLNDQAVRPPTQFLVTPEYIVIMPAGHRALAYDGERIDYLGYDRAPGAPLVYTSSLANDVMFGVGWGIFHADFGLGRLGTISNEHGDNSRLRGGYEWATQWVDVWSNLSPWSARSNAVSWAKLTPATGNAEATRPPAHIANIEPGPGATRGRMVARSKDREHAGTNDLFVLPNAQGGNYSGRFATIPDNSAQVLPDNAPDTWLALPIVEVDPLPVVRWGRLAFGRAWYNPDAEPGVLLGTLRGRWGTPQKDLRIQPDPAGGELTGAWAFGGRMLVWTRTTTFVVTPLENVDGFRYDILHPGVGCAGPSAMASLADGSLVWLSYEGGFYRYDGRGVLPLPVSDDIGGTVDGLNKARLAQACAAFDSDSQEFRIWVPNGGSRENNLCLILDVATSGWRRRDGEDLRAVCVTQDHRRLMVGVGYVTPSGGAPTSGAWVLDRRDPGFTEPARQYIIRTGFYAPSSREKATSPMTVFPIFRETRASAVAMTTTRDWRYGATQDSGATLIPQQPNDLPPVWGTTTWGTSSRWVRRRPVFLKVDIYLPAASSFQIQFLSTAGFEWIGCSSSDIPRPEHARAERSS